MKIARKFMGSVMKQLCLLVVVTASLSACGLAARMDAHTDMETSKAAYKSCLAANPANSSACESARLAYEADLKAFEATGGMAASREP
jgi:hypothetical protein